jgi:hypothetical protein
MAAAQSSSSGLRSSPLAGERQLRPGKARGSEGLAPTTCAPPAARRLKLPSWPPPSSGGRRGASCRGAAAGAAHPRRGGSAASAGPRPALEPVRQPTRLTPARGSGGRRSSSRRSSRRERERDIERLRIGRFGRWLGRPIVGHPIPSITEKIYI